MKEEVSICWLRRDLRLHDNVALYHALKSDEKVILLFIFDTDILNKLPDRRDSRVAFIHESLVTINQHLNEYGSSVYILQGSPLEVSDFAKEKKILFNTYKDQVIFEKSEVMKKDGTPYTVFTPYSKIWKQQYLQAALTEYPSEELLANLYQCPQVILLNPKFKMNLFGIIIKREIFQPLQALQGWGFI